MDMNTAILKIKRALQSLIPPHMKLKLLPWPKLVKEASITSLSKTSYIELVHLLTPPTPTCAIDITPARAFEANFAVHGFDRIVIHNGRWTNDVSPGKSMEETIPNWMREVDEESLRYRAQHPVAWAIKDPEFDPPYDYDEENPFKHGFVYAIMDPTEVNDMSIVMFCHGTDDEESRSISVFHFDCSYALRMPLGTRNRIYDPILSQIRKSTDYRVPCWNGEDYVEPPNPRHKAYPMPYHDFQDMFYYSCTCDHLQKVVDAIKKLGPDIEAECRHEAVALAMELVDKGEWKDCTCPRDIEDWAAYRKHKRDKRIEKEENRARIERVLEVRDLEDVNPDVDEVVPRKRDYPVTPCMKETSEDKLKIANQFFDFESRDDLIGRYW